MGGSASSNCAWCVLVWFFSYFLGGFFVGMVGGEVGLGLGLELGAYGCSLYWGFFLEREGGGFMCR